MTSESPPAPTTGQEPMSPSVATSSESHSSPTSSGLNLTTKGSSSDDDQHHEDSLDHHQDEEKDHLSPSGENLLGSPASGSDGETTGHEGSPSSATTNGKMTDSASSLAMSPPPSTSPNQTSSGSPSTAHLNNNNNTINTSSSNVNHGPSLLSSSSSFSSTTSSSAHHHHPPSSASSTSTRPLRLRRVNHSDEIVSGFGKLIKNESMTDVTLSCGGGLTIRAHRVILSTFSPYFRSIFESPPFLDSPWTYPVVVMKDYGYAEVKAIVEFIYRGEVSVPRDRLASVLATARALEVSGLADLKPETYGVSGGGTTATGTGNVSNSSGNNGLSGGGQQPSPVSLVNGFASSSSTTPAAASAPPAPSGGLVGLGGSMSSPSSGSSPSTAAATAAAIIAAATRDASSSSSLHHHLHQQQQQQLHHHLLSHSASSPSSGVKRNLATANSSSDLLADVYSTSEASLASVMAKKLRGCLTDGGGSSSPTPSAVESAFNVLASSGGLSLEGVKSLLSQSPNTRLPNSVLGQLMQHTQQIRQQQLQQQLLSGRGQSPTPSSGNSGQQRNVSLQQIMSLNNGNGSGRSQPPTPPQRQSLSTPVSVTGRNGSIHGQSTGGIKQQILQQQLLRAKNGNQSHGSSLFRSTASATTNQHPFAAFQQRIRQQIHEKAKTGGNLARHSLFGHGPQTTPVKIEDSRKISRNHEDDELQVVVHDTNVHDQDDDSGVDGNDDLVNGGQRQEDQQQTHLADDNEDELDDQEEYEMEIDKDAIFQQQQQLRLQQLQKQQQQYQYQMQLAEQEEQEQRLMEYHQSISQAATAAALAAAAAAANSSGPGSNQSASREQDDDNDDTGSGFGFDWQEGFTDDLPYPGQKESSSSPSLMKNHLQSSNINSNSSSKNSTPIQTPDFLQPRGPGRPRKGNKAQEISPCPECNKVFVRPDVLKLHYRSVHLNERHPCNLCPKIFKWPGDLSKHKRTKHPDKYPPVSAQ